MHEFSPHFREDAIFRHIDVVDQVRKENEIITSMANVLNSTSLPDSIAVQSDEPIDIMVKRDENKLYIFAVAMTNSVAQPQFHLNGVDGAEAVVVGEGRSITIQHGQFIEGLIQRVCGSHFLYNLFNRRPVSRRLREGQRRIGLAFWRSSGVANWNVPTEVQIARISDPHKLREYTYSEKA